MALLRCWSQRPSSKSRESEVGFNTVFESPIVLQSQLRGNRLTGKNGRLSLCSAGDSDRIIWKQQFLSESALKPSSDVNVYEIELATYDNIAPGEAVSGNL